MHTPDHEPTTPPPVSPDGRFFWDGQRWVPLPQPPAAHLGGRAAEHSGNQPGLVAWIRSVFWLGMAILAILIALSWTGYVDLSNLPVSIPGVVEHCAVRYPGTNVIVTYDGRNADRSCEGAVAQGWNTFAGPPLGGLACYGGSGSPSWKVYDTGMMLGASDVCGRLSAQ